MRINWECVYGRLKSLFSEQNVGVYAGFAMIINVFVVAPLFIVVMNEMKSGPLILYLAFLAFVIPHLTGFAYFVFFYKAKYGSVFGGDRVWRQDVIVGSNLNERNEQ